MTFGAPNWGCDEATSHRIIEQYIDAGGNSLDVADVYAGGTAEEHIGTFLSQINREDVIIASKCYFPTGTKPNQYGTSRKRIIASCEASLKRMKTDYVDVYYLHGADPVAPMEEQMGALNELVRQGKARYAACSNFYGWQISKANGVAARLNMVPMVAGQFLYNLIQRGPEREILPAAADEGLGVFCYSPLGGGLLTGKYTDSKKPAAGTRLSYRAQVDGPRFWHQRGFETAEKLKKVADDVGIPMAKLAIAWPLGRRCVASVIVGVRTEEQLATNLELGDWDMPQDVWDRLEEETRPEEDYLTWFNKVNYQRFWSAVEYHDESKNLL
jgi:aryl-alcohol dehydrogenase-like predicted oxidoreductase